LESEEKDREKWQAAVQKRADALRGLSDLSQALMLRGWGGRGVDPSPMRDPREGIARRFEKAMREVLDGKEPARKCAAVTLFGDMGSSDGYRPRLYDDPLMEGVLTRLLPDVVRQAEGTDADLRECVARALGHVPLPDKAAPPLGKLLADKEPAVKRAAAEALERQARGGDPLPERDGEAGESMVALGACPAVVPEAVKGLKDKDDRVRRHCLGAVRAGGVALKWAAGCLAERRADAPAGDESSVRAGQRRSLESAAAALAAAVPGVHELVKEDDAGQCVRACQALEAVAAGRSGLLNFPAPGKDPLLAGLKETLPSLEKRVRHKDIEVRLAALYVLEELGPEAAPAAAVTAGALKDDDPFVRWAAARVLGRAAPAEAKTAVPALASRVKDDNGDVRITVLAALERYGPEAAPAVKEVSQALKSGDEQTRLWAVRVLVAVGPKGRKETVGPLTEALSAKETTIRRAAARGLARLGAPDEATAPALRAALKDADAEVRRAAAEALLAEK
jgi:HEAT repeat protein